MEELMTCIIDIGEQMLINGAEVPRVEESLRRMFLALGCKRAETFIITSSMVVTIYTNDGKYLTQTRRIEKSDIDFEMVHRLNKLSRKICEEKPGLEQIRDELQKTVVHKTYPFWLECAAYAAIASSFTVFFGGGPDEAAVSLIVGLIVRFVILVAQKSVSSRIFSKFLSSLIATLLAYGAHNLGWSESIDTVIIGNIMTLIPGIGLTNAFRDLFTGNSITGILRGIEACLTAIAIAAGYIIVAWLGGAVL